MGRIKICLKITKKCFLPDTAFLIWNFKCYSLIWIVAIAIATFTNIIIIQKCKNHHQAANQSVYDAVSDLMYNRFAHRPDFKSAVRMVKMVLNTQCYQYLWLTVWFHAKNRKKHSKNQNRWFYHVNSAPELRNYQKSPKKRITQSRFTQFFV